MIKRLVVTEYAGKEMVVRAFHRYDKCKASERLASASIEDCTRKFRPVRTYKEYNTYLQCFDK